MNAVIIAVSSLFDVVVRYVVLPLFLPSEKGGQFNDVAMTVSSVVDVVLYVVLPLFLLSEKGGQFNDVAMTVSSVD